MNKDLKLLTWVLDLTGKNPKDELMVEIQKLPDNDPSLMPILISIRLGKRFKVLYQYFPWLLSVASVLLNVLLLIVN